MLPVAFGGSASSRVPNGASISLDGKEGDMAWERNGESLNAAKRRKALVDEFSRSALDRESD